MVNPKPIIGNEIGKLNIAINNCLPEIFELMNDVKVSIIPIAITQSKINIIQWKLNSTFIGNKIQKANHNTNEYKANSVITKIHLLPN